MVFFLYHEELIEYKKIWLIMIIKLTLEEEIVWLFQIYVITS